LDLHTVHAVSAEKWVVRLTAGFHYRIGFWGDGWQIGAYLAAFTIVLYTVEIALSMCTKSRAGFA
jgi:hypothetical protein